MPQLDPYLVFDDAKVTMPTGETFWAEAFGMLTDRYGTPWMANGAMRSV